MNDSFPPQIDGVANAVLNYAEIIQRRYGNALVAAPYYPDYTDSFPYRVIRYQSIDLSHKVGYRAGNPFDPKAIDAISKEPVDILHAHCPVTAVMLGRTIRETRNIPMVLTYHTKFDIDIRNAISAKLLQDAAIKTLVRNIESCDEVWVVSRGAGENLRSLGYKGEYTVMENGVDMPKGRASQEEVEQIRREFDLDPAVPTFLFVGRMMWYKGIRIILDAVKTVSGIPVPFRMLFVGSGVEEEEIKAYARELDIMDRCIFVGAVRDRQKLRCFYTMADMFVFPSTFDTNGLVVREAAACGLASILVRGSCASEGVTDGQNGILIDETSDSLARVLAEISNNREKMLTLGEHAMDELYCSWETSVQKAVQRYQDIIRQKRRSILRPGSIDDRFYRSIGDTYNAIQKIRSYYDLALEQRNELFENTGGYAEYLIDQVIERRDALRDQIISNITRQKKDEKK